MINVWEWLTGYLPGLLKFHAARLKVKAVRRVWDRIRPRTTRNGYADQMAEHSRALGHLSDDEWARQMLDYDDQWRRRDGSPPP